MNLTESKKIKERDLSAPVKEWFEAQGYQVFGEVKHCDLVARKQTELIAIELKLGFSLALVYQGLRRQEHCHTVYLAVALNNGKSTIPKLNEVRRLCMRLKLGLIVVKFLKSKTKVELACKPDELIIKNRPAKRAAIIKEIDGRYAEFNSGGLPSSVRKMSAYRQRSLVLAWLLSSLDGGSSPSKLIERGGDSRAGLMLNANYYGWFDHPARGLYSLSVEGKQALLHYIQELEVIKKSLLA